MLALTTLPNGDLVAGGGFTTDGGVSASNIARWNGTSWSPLGAGMNDDVMALAVLANGDLVAGGAFSSAGGAPAHFVARWNDRSNGQNAPTVSVRPFEAAIRVIWDARPISTRST
ncbi:MAG TPA: hypothetical protein VF384_12090 [Planctomycetota bacterium]